MQPFSLVWYNVLTWNLLFDSSCFKCFHDSQNYSICTFYSFTHTQVQHNRTQNTHTNRLLSQPPSYISILLFFLIHYSWCLHLSHRTRAPLLPKRAQRVKTFWCLHLSHRTRAPLLLKIAQRVKKFLCLHLSHRTRAPLLSKRAQKDSERIAK